MVVRRLFSTRDHKRSTNTLKQHKDTNFTGEGGGIKGPLLLSLADAYAFV